MAQEGIPEHPTNGDEEQFPNKIGNYSKGLRHNAIGEVDPGAYEAMIRAIDSGRFADYEALATNGHLGAGDPTRQRRLVNPMSGYAFDVEGLDSHQFSMRAAPSFSSPEEAGEMVELYWMSMLRDVNYLDYEAHPLANLAAEDLSRLSDFRGPKQGNRVTPQTLFRDNFPGCTVGPYVSQFLLKNCPFGAQLVDQRIRTVMAGTDFMTDFQSWLDIQNGIQPTQAIPLDEPRFCRNGRDLGAYVHVDALYQAYFVAGLVLLANNMPWDSNNPYGQTPEGGSGRPLPAGAPGSLAQVGFTTFGGPHILALLTEVSSRAQKAVWFHKFLVHRRLRPEEFGGRVEVVRRNLAPYPIHSDLFRSRALDQVFSKFGSYLLPQAFPEGSPLHTSYGSGHATTAGACITILKAFFDESAIIPDPVVPNSDGSGLIPYEGPELTVGGELNKIASNIAQGRNQAGIHCYLNSTNSRIAESTYAGHTTVAVVGCATCHDTSATNDPHLTGLPYTAGSFPLRVPSGANDEAIIEKSATAGTSGGTPAGKYGKGNACVWCHKSRKDVTNYITASNNLTSIHWGPHEGPQSDIYTGKGGYQYPNKTYGASTHQSFTNGCVDCHMPAVASNAGVGNHSFYPQLSSCQKAGCHVNATNFDVGGGQSAMKSLLIALRTELNTKGWLTRSETAPYEALTTAELADQHFAEDKVRPLATGATPLTAAEAGALYNYLLLARGAGGGAHNPIYVRQLIFDSYQALTGNPPPGLTVRP
jgi:hypothetical protein